MTVHFCERVRERGPEGIDAERLRDEVRHAVLTGDETLAERVKRLDDGIAYYRIKLGAHGVFYAVCNEVTGVPITFYTQAQYRKKRYGLKCRRRNLPRPH